jgi:elongation factor Ts
MAISASDVKRLRDMTGVGMMDCKKALEEAGGDFDEAIDLLRKKGQKVASKRAEREANEGLIVTALSDDGKTGVLVEVNCETDFVARNDEFRRFASDVATLVLREQPTDLAGLERLGLGGGETVADRVVSLTGKIGERLQVRRFALLASDAGRIVSYVHPGSRLGVLVEVLGNGRIDEAGVDVAMQIAAMNPVATRKEEVPAEVQEKELDIAREAARNEGKPEQIIERIATGRLDRFFKDNVLIEQPFVKDASMTVREMLVKADVGVRRFVRYALGE